MDHAFISHTSIQAIAHSIDLPKLSEEAAKALSPDVDYRLREIIQDALKFARHSKRTKITTEDVSDALRLRNFEPLYGFSNKDPAKFIRATGHPDVCIIQDRVLSFEQLLDEPLPRPPVDVGLMPHWLFINGVQPAIPENAPLERPVSRRVRQQARGSAPVTKAKQAMAADTQEAVGTASAAALATGQVQVQQPVQHLLSKELQLYFDKVVMLLKGPVSTNGASRQTPLFGDLDQQSEPARLKRAALESLATDPGLHPLAPYFTKFIADEVAAGLRSLPTLRTLLALASALLSNPHMKLEHYVHQLLPPVLTCLVAKSLGSNNQDNHWGVREAAAVLVKQVCTRFSDPFFNVQPRISKTLIKAFLDPSKPLATHYGAVIGLAALGHSTVSMLLVPQLQPYMARLQPVLDNASLAPENGATSLSIGASAARRADAYRVHGALLDAVSGAMYERLVASAALGKPLSRRSRKAVKPAAAADRQGAAAGTTDEAGDTVMQDASPSAAAAAAAPPAPAPAPAAAGLNQSGGSKEPELKTLKDGSVSAAAPAQKQELDEGDTGLVCSVLAESWREEADLGRVLWALEQLFHEPLLARLPLPHPPAFFL